jgi:hypothetical protein
VLRRGIFVRKVGLNSATQMSMRTALAQAKAALAQLVEHRIRNAGVVGSNPIGGTIYSALCITYRKPLLGFNGTVRDKAGWA